MTPKPLKRPCAHCPFKAGAAPFLDPERVDEILTALFHQDQSFWCHETVTYDDDAYEDYYVGTGAEVQCAGAAHLLEREGASTQLMRIEYRLGLRAESTEEDRAHSITLDDLCRLYDLDPDDYRPDLVEYDEEDEVGWDHWLDDETLEAKSDAAKREWLSDDE